MRVEQQNQILEALQQAAGKDVKTASGIVAEKAKTIKSVSDRQTSIQMKDTTYLNPAREEKKSIAEKIEESSEMDAFERKNQMAVLSNTTSERPRRLMPKSARTRWRCCPTLPPRKIMRKCRRKVFPWIPQIRIRSSR